jgi:hypothetical protein
VIQPYERLEGARQLAEPFDYMRDRWFILVGSLLIAFLLVSLIVIQYRRRVHDSTAAENAFEENSDTRGLSKREREFLREIASRSGVRSIETIFINSDAFDFGATLMMHEKFRNAADLDERKMFYKKIVALKDKVGLKRKTYASAVRSATSARITSRYISQGREVMLSTLDNSRKRIEGQVVENNDLEMWIRPEMSLEVIPGQRWRVTCEFGGSVWEFESLAIGASSGNLILSHSDNVRFINRRRFLRVPIDRPAWICKFPCTRQLQMEDGHPIESRIPRFVPGRLVEISGPGFLIDVELKARPNDRVLVITALEDDRVVQDLAEVRHCRVYNNKTQLAVELVGLNEPTTSYLIKRTNELAMKKDIDNTAEKVLTGKGA